MPAIDTRPRTLKGVIEAVLADDSIPRKAKTELASAVRTVCRCAGRDPSEVDANPVAIRVLVRSAQPQLAGVSVGHFRNALSRLTRALKHVSIAVDRRRDMPISPEWDTLLDEAEKRDKHFRTDLRKFAGYCSTRDILPTAVGPETFVDFFDYLRTQSIQHNYRERAHRARRAWNAAIAVEGSSYPKIENIFGDRPARLKLKDMPASFAEDCERYVAAATTPSIISERYEPIKERTARNYVINLTLLAHSAVEDGVPLSTLTSLAALLDPDVVARGLERMQATLTVERSRTKADQSDGAPPRSRSSKTNSTTWFTIVHATAYAAVAVAKDVLTDDTTITELKRIARKIGAAFKKQRKGMTSKNKARLAQFDDPRARYLFLNLPREVFRRHAQAEPTFKRAREIQDAVLLAVLQDLPIRVGNAAALNLERHFIRSSNGAWRVSISGVEVKNEEDIDCVLTPEVSAMLEQYVREYRPIISAKPSSILFPNRDGAAKRETTIWAQFSAFIRRELGLECNPHLMRHFSVCLWIKKNPGDFETPRLVLGHKTTETTRGPYAHLQQHEAMDRYHAVLRRERNGNPAPNSQEFDFGRRKRKASS